MRGAFAWAAVAAALLVGCGQHNNDRDAVRRAFHAYVVKAVTGDASLCDEVFTGAEPWRYVERDRALCRLGAKRTRQKVTIRERHAAATLQPSQVKVHGRIATVSFSPPAALRGWFSPAYFHKTAHGWRIEAVAASKCANGDPSCPT
jgi:hypothetical protein